MASDVLKTIYRTLSFLRRREDRSEKTSPWMSTTSSRSQVRSQHVSDSLIVRRHTSEESSTANHVLKYKTSHIRSINYSFRWLAEKEVHGKSHFFTASTRR